MQLGPPLQLDTLSSLRHGAWTGLERARGMRVFIDGLGLPIRGGARSSMLGWMTSLGKYGPQNRYEVFVSRRESVLNTFESIRQHIVPLKNRYAVRVWAQI